MISKANKLFDSYEKKCQELNLSVPDRAEWVSREMKITTMKNMPRHLKRALSKEMSRSTELHNTNF